MPQQKLLAPNEKIVWVPYAGLANFMIPTTTLLNAGSDISCATVTGYTLNATDSDTDDSRSICDSANTDEFTFSNYEANFSFFRGDIVTPLAVYTTAFNLFKQAGANGYLVRRIGKLNSLPFVVGDVVSVFGVESDNPQDDPTEGGGAMTYTVPFLPTGSMNLNFTLAA